MEHDKVTNKHDLEELRNYGNIPLSGNAVDDHEDYLKGESYMVLCVYICYNLRKSKFLWLKDGKGFHGFELYRFIGCCQGKSVEAIIV